MTVAALVLAGGRSTRMGAPKAWLEWHGSTLLRRAVGIVARVADGPVIVVRAPGQALPPLPAEVELAHDARPGRGPLEAIAAGLAAVGARADVAFACAVDMPLLHPALVRRVVAALGPDDDVALPVVDGFAQPLAGAYRTALAPLLEELLAAGPRGTGALLARCRTRRLEAGELLDDPRLAAVDPELRSLSNVNDPDAYAAARALPAPEVVVAGRGAIRAATLAGAGGGRALVDGRAVSDPEEPLVAGDRVVFAAAAPDERSALAP